MLIWLNKASVIYPRQILSISRSRIAMPTMSTLENICQGNCALKNKKENFKSINTLNKCNVKMSDIDRVEEKLKELINAGPAKLQILADFDFTLSNYILPNGTKAMSTHAVLENAEAKKLTEKYIVIEYDPNLSVEEKIPHMVEWWTRSHEELVKDNYNEEKLRNIIRSSKGLILRKGFRDFFALLEKYDIPIVIFSGGIGDIIKIILEENLGKLPKNVHIISNWMSYDSQGNVVGFKNPIVHSFNKNSSVIKEEDKEFFVNLRSRPNILLMGDSLGDAAMDVGLEKEMVAFKIGFLNFSVEKSMQDYLEKFDVLCVQDQTLDSTIEILSAIIGHQVDMNGSS